LSPYAVANKSYAVNDRLAFESQLIQAVILQRAPIKGRLRVHYRGEGAARVCHVSAELKDGELVDYTSPPFGDITPKNSPLWKSDPDQQHYYYSARALCRRHFPDVLLGIYARDELEDSPRIGPDRARDVTPPKTIGEKLDMLAKQAIDANNAMTEALAEAEPGNWEEVRAQPIPDELAGQMDAFADKHVTLDVGPDAFDEPDPRKVNNAQSAAEFEHIESVRARARADAAKGIRRMAPTSLSEAERAVYLQSFDDAKEAEDE
jgi:hypothetical protein